MRQSPRRESVGGESRVDHRDRARDVALAQVDVESLQLVRPEHPLVNHRARREARHVAVAARNLAQRGLDSPPNHVEGDLERRAGIDLARDADLPDEYLPHRRPGAPRGSGEDRVVDRNIAPAEHRAPFGGDSRFDDALADETVGATRWKEDGADAVGPRVGKRDSERAANPAQESVRDLDQDAGAVAGTSVSRDRAPVREILEQLERLRDDVAGADAVDVGDKPNPARVVLVSRVVQSLLFRHRLSPELLLPNGCRIYIKKGPLPIWERPFARLFQQPAMSPCWCPRKFSPSPSVESTPEKGEFDN